MHDCPEMVDSWLRDRAEIDWDNIKPMPPEISQKLGPQYLISARAASALCSSEEKARSHVRTVFLIGWTVINYRMNTPLAGFICKHF